ncbi:MAG: hypothetical protein OHK0015_28550 [Chloroflexi bacterium OHK40]
MPLSVTPSARAPAGKGLSPPRRRASRGWHTPTGRGAQAHRYGSAKPICAGSRRQRPVTPAPAGVQGVAVPPTPAQAGADWQQNGTAHPDTPGVPYAPGPS